MMKLMNPFDDEVLKQIFKLSKNNKNLIGTHESTTIEFKQSFGWKYSRYEYFKTMAAYANREGGYIIFGVGDKPKELFGLVNDSLNDFNSIDNDQWSNGLRSTFSPEIKWDKTCYEIYGKFFGIIYTYILDSKPAICKVGNRELRKGAIYYRYNSQSTDIEYTELSAIIQNEKNKSINLLKSFIDKATSIGLSNMALLDLEKGELSGKNTTLHIDEKLIEKIKFIQEGRFVETGGEPTLKIIGDINNITTGEGIIIERPQHVAINSDVIIRAFLEQETVVSPLEYIKQISYQNTSNFPIYYYIKLSGEKIHEIVDYIEKLEIKNQMKNDLLKRIKSKVTKFTVVSFQETEAYKIKERFLNDVVNERLSMPQDDVKIKHLLIAIKGIKSPIVYEHKDYILSVLLQIYNSFFNEPNYKSIKTEFRHALCWIDEALYNV